MHTLDHTGKIITLLCATCSLFVSAQEPVLQERFWMPSGGATTVLPDPAHDRVYLGGSFTQLITKAPNGNAMDTEGQPWPDPEQTRPDEEVRVVVADGAGGWFIGGDFMNVGSAPRAHLAHIDANGMVTPWTADCDARVLALALDNGVLYVGGYFTSIGGVSRNYVAALDAATGVVSDWAPDPDVYVNELEVTPNTVYIAGAFSSIGSSGRSGLAEVDRTTGIATAFNPDFTNGGANDLLRKDDILFIGGSFDMVNGEPRDNLAAVNAMTGATTPWPAYTNGTVRCLALDGETLYVGGEFTQISGQFYSHLAGVNTNTGTLVGSSYFGLDDDVNTMELHDGLLYIAGPFYEVADSVRHNIAAIDLATDQTTNFTCHIGYSPFGANLNDLALSGSRLYIGGAYFCAGARLQSNLAALSLSTGRPIDWKPPYIGGAISVLKLHGENIFVAGNFTAIGGITRYYLAELTWDTALLTDWDPHGDVGIRSLALTDTALIVGGSFGSMGLTPHTNLAMVQPGTGATYPWLSPYTSGSWYDLLPTDSTLLIAGETIGSDGAVRRINIHPSEHLWSWSNGGRMYEIALLDTVIFAGGYERFITLGKVSGLPVPPWDDLPLNYTVYDLDLMGDKIILGGDFVLDNGLGSRLVMLDVNTGDILPWHPIDDHSPTEIVHSGSLLFVSGGFYNVNAEEWPYFAVFETGDITTGEAPTVLTTAQHICAFPNPSSGQLRLRADGQRPSMMEVHDATGTLVHRSVFKDELDLGRIASGLYSIRAIGKDGALLGTTRWVKE